MGIDFGGLQPGESRIIEVKIDGPVDADLADLFAETLNAVLHVYKLKLQNEGEGGDLTVTKSGTV
jgi:hypothetical protein